MNEIKTRYSHYTLAFSDKVLEQRYRHIYFSRTVSQLRHGFLLAIFLFLAFLPFDLLFLGADGENAAVFAAIAIRLTVILVILFTIVLTYAPGGMNFARLSIIGWFSAFLALWLLCALPAYLPDSGITMLDTGYIYAFVLISLGSTIYLPLLFSQSIILQLFLLLPIAHLCLLEVDRGTFNAANVAFSAIIVVATSLMGMYAKYFSELSERRNFVQDRDLRDAQFRAEAASRAKSQFLAMVSHELRTPLNGIIGNLQLAQDGASKEDLDAALADAERSGLAMRNIINDLLDITGLDASQPDHVSNTTFWLMDVIDDVEAAVKVAARSRGLCLSFPLPHALDVAVRGDARRLRHILLNLVGNAVKFTQQGSVTVDCTLGEAVIALTVSDTGIGIPDGQLDHVFEEFFRASNAREAGLVGTGLGLAIVRRMVTECGGTVVMDSRVGRGTKVSVTLPFAKVPGVVRVSEERTRVESVGRPLRVLLVEDDPVNMAVLRRFLRSDGHFVAEATTARAALELFDPARLDCVLTDIQLPDLEGTELAARLHERMGSGKKTPIVAVTANVFPEDLHRYRDAGFREVVAKPIDRDQLFALLRRVCGSGDPHEAVSDRLSMGERSKELEEMLGPAEFRRVLGAFLDSLDDTLHQFELAGREGDGDRIRLLAHRLSGSAASLGFDDLANCARELESSAAAGSWPATSRLEALISVVKQLLTDEKVRRVNLPTFDFE